MNLCIHPLDTYSGLSSSEDALHSPSSLGSSSAAAVPMHSGRTRCSDLSQTEEHVIKEISVKILQLYKEFLKIIINISVSSAFNSAKAKK